MQRWRGIEHTPRGWGRSVVTIGVFDGVHRGHQKIIGRAVELAAERGLQSVVVSFDPHPSEVVRPGSHPAILTELDRRGDLVAELGVDGFCVLPFTREFSRLSPEEFVHDVLVSQLHAAHVVVGDNFRFGHKAAGDTQLLRRLGTSFGFEIEDVGLTGEGTTIFSSTYIRACVDAGDVSAAAEALGRPHRVAGMVMRGAGRGDSQLGFPTANLHHAPHAAVPADGIYAGWLRRSVAGGDPLPAAISIGTNPTFAGAHRSLEAYVLDFKGDLYGEPVSLDFIARIREQRVYDSLPPLIAQMEQDEAETRRLLELG